MPSDNNWSPPTGSGERRLSNSSDGSSGSGYSKALPSDPNDYLALRGKVPGGKPPANPLQFVKVGPCDLYRSAQAQLQRAQQVKKNKEVNKEELEDWQSNLDNWKSCRRKRVEHIIERCVEVKRMENEPVPGARAKSKTFNEMLEERAGKRRRCPLALYPEEEATDLSDLGIGTSSTKSSLSEDCDTHSLASDGIDLDKNHSDVENVSNSGSVNRKLGSSANEYDTCTTTTISSPEPEEYTYEGAIEGYKSRMSTDYKGYSYDKEKTPEKVSNGDISRIRTTVSNKIEERVSSLQSKADIKSTAKKDLPKVDILKRRETFEMGSAPDTNSKPKLTQISNKKSIKERLSSLEKFTEEQSKSSNDVSRGMSAEVMPLKQRLSSLEKIKSAPEVDKSKTLLSNGDLANTKSVKERLSSLKSQTSEDDLKIVKSEVKEVSMSIKERLSSLDAAKNKEIQKRIVLHEDTKEAEPKDQSLKTTLSGIETQMQNFCRSLDSLDINGTTSPSSFERVQSMEELESSNEARNITSPSDVETEDSGIHTGQNHDDNHLDISAGEHAVSEYESSEEPFNIKESVDDEEQDASKADTDSTSNYMQAVSQPNDDLSATDDITEIQFDKDDEETLKSLDAQDTSVIDALEMAFQEIDEEPPKLSNVENKDEANDAKQSAMKTNEQSEKVSQSVDKEATKHRGALDERGIVGTKQNEVAADYKNILFDSSVVLDATVLDAPLTVLEPPKEKPPPPPPAEDVMVADIPLGNGDFKSLNSTRRIKKEIRNKRTSFLGLQHPDDDYLDLSPAPRPDITQFLQEETKIEKLLYKKTLSHADATLRDSRDSGVDLETQHSRQNSEPYAQVVVTSDEEESGTKNARVAEQRFGEQLNTKLEKIQTGEKPTEGRGQGSEKDKIDSLDEQLQKQQEVLRFERELLQLEQEELRRQRENLLLRESQTRCMQKSVTDVNSLLNGDAYRPSDHRRSMPNLLQRDSEFAAYNLAVKQNGGYSGQMPLEISRKYDSTRQFESPRQPDGRMLDRPRPIDGSPKRQISNVRPAPPPPKPRSKESMERESTMRCSRVTSAADYVNVEKMAAPRPKPIVNGHVPPPTNGHHPMTRNSLQALSAAPTSKLISGADWLQARSRKQIPPSFNYSQHWLIQEAEQRRIEDQLNKMRPPLPKQQPMPNQRHSYHHDPTQHGPVPRVPMLSTSQQQVSGEAVLPELQRGSNESVLSVSGRRKCSHCGQELGRGAAMIIESLGLCYHVWCFSCVVCGARLGDGRAGADVRVRARKLHCHQCYSSDDGSKFSCV